MKKDFLHKMQGKLKHQFSNFKYWFNKKPQYKKFSTPLFFYNLLITSIFSIIIAILYSQIEKLNQIKLIVVGLGTVLILVATFFLIKYSFKVLKGIKLFYRDSRNGVKYIVLLSLFLFLVFAYKNSDKIISPAFDSEIYNKIETISTTGNVDISKNYELSELMPMPWGYVILFGLAIIGFFIVWSYIFKQEVSGVLIFIVMFIAFIVANQVRIPYNTVNIRDYEAHCVNDNFRLKNNIMGFGEMSLAMNCMEYKSSGCQPSCVDNKPVCICKATILDVTFSREGDWIFGGLFG